MNENAGTTAHATHVCPRCGTLHRLPDNPTPAELHCRQCDWALRPIKEG